MSQQRSRGRAWKPDATGARCVRCARTWGGHAGSSCYPVPDPAIDAFDPPRPELLELGEAADASRRSSPSRPGDPVDERDTSRVDALQTGRLCAWCTDPIPAVSPSGRRTRADTVTCGVICRKRRNRFLRAVRAGTPAQAQPPGGRVPSRRRARAVRLRRPALSRLRALLRRAAGGRPRRAGRPADRRATPTAGHCRRARPRCARSCRCAPPARASASGVGASASARANARSAPGSRCSSSVAASSPPTRRRTSSTTCRPTTSSSTTCSTTAAATTASTARSSA